VEVFAMIKLIAILGLVGLQACSSPHSRNPSAYERRNADRAKSEMSFTNYYTYQPSRAKGGETIQIEFIEPKSLKEIGFEYVNYPVQLHHVTVISASGHRLPIPALRSQRLTGARPVLLFDGLAQDLKISKLIIQAEGYEHNSVAFTLSLFSIDGFLAQEKQVNAPEMNLNYQAHQPGPDQIPSCYLKDSELRRYLFNFDELSAPSSQRHFCEHFVPEFKGFLTRFPQQADFLRTGVAGVKPLFIVSNHLKYDQEHHELFIPLRLGRQHQSELVKLSQLSKEIISGSRMAQVPKTQARYSLSEFLENEEGSSRLSYADEFGAEFDQGDRESCVKNYQSLGVNTTQAKRYCQQVVGFEQGHFECFESLLAHHFPSNSAHHACVESRGKWVSYLPCIANLNQLNFSHHDSHQFCVRTPDGLMQAQVECVQSLKKRDISSYLTLKSCQRHWGKEHELTQCLEQRQPASGDERLRNCLR
jgi:hypothetical protein